MRGKIVKINDDKRYGFIKGEDEREYFFHAVDFDGFFNDLVVDIRDGRAIEVAFTPTQTDKGLRASTVSRTDGGV